MRFRFQSKWKRHSESATKITREEGTPPSQKRSYVNVFSADGKTPGKRSDFTPQCDLLPLSSTVNARDHDEADDRHDPNSDLAARAVPFSDWLKWSSFITVGRAASARDKNHSQRYLPLLLHLFRERVWCASGLRKMLNVGIESVVTFWSKHWNRPRITDIFITQSYEY